MEIKENIELKTITENNYKDCLRLNAAVENENFVDSVVYSLAEAWVFYKDTKPFAVYKNNTLIGFVSMYIGEKNYQIINFLIDSAFQKKGYGSAAAKICIEYLHTIYNAAVVSVPVELENTAAQTFWKKLGFSFSGTVEDGYIFMRLQL